MNPVLYQLNAVLPDGSHVPGQNVWSGPVTITRALLSCAVRPASGTLTLTLEVGGVLQSDAFVVEPGAGEFVHELTPDVEVPANVEVRWKASFDGIAEDAATQLSITMEVVPTAAVSASRLTLRWVEGVERITLYDYNRSTREFIPINASVAESRATIIKDGNLSISFAIRGHEVLFVETGVLSARSFSAGMGIATLQSPRLEFCVNDVAIGTLTTLDFRVVDLVEMDVVAPGLSEQFEFWSAGGLTAALSNNGLFARTVLEVDS